MNKTNWIEVTEPHPGVIRIRLADVSSNCSSKDGHQLAITMTDYEALELVDKINAILRVTV